MPAPIVYPLVALACTAALAFLLTGLQIRSNRALRLTAAPRDDRWHRQPTPSSGGIAIFMAIAAAYCIWFPGRHLAIALGSAAIWMLGLADDKLRLPPLAKLAGQCVIGAAVVASGVVFPATQSPAFNLAFSFLWLVGMANAFNLIDNMDGLCAGVAVIISLFRVFLLASSGNWDDAWLAGLVGAAYCGFLFWNYRPARIFMGDCGSMLAGFSLAALTIAGPPAHTKAFAAGLFYPALTFTYPIFDTALVSILRKLAGRPISVGGRDHSSHRLVLAGLTESRTVWILWMLTASGCGVGLMARAMPFGVAIAGCLLGVALVIFGIFLATLPVYPLPLGNSIPAGSWVRRRIPSLRAGIILILDVAIGGIALLLAFLLRFGPHLPPQQLRNLTVALPAALLFQTAISCCTRAFELSWSSVRVRDLLVLVRNAGLAAAGSSLAIWLFHLNDYSPAVVAQQFLYCAAGTIAMRAVMPLVPAFYTCGRRTITTPNCMTVPYAPGSPSENLMIVNPVRTEMPS